MITLVFLRVLVTASPMIGTTQEPADRPPRLAPAGVTAFVDVNVVPMDAERVLANHTVVVVAGRITGLGPVSQVTIPSEAMRIDGRSQYLIPGLADMHVHMRGPKSERELLKWLAQGITTVRNMDFAAAPPQVEQALLQQRAQAVAGELWSPRIYTSGDWTRGRVNVSYFTSQMATADPAMSNTIWKDIKPESVATYIASYKAAGYDFIKAHDETAQIFDSVLAAARRVGIPIGGHVPLQVTLDQAMGGMQSIEHLTGSFKGRGVGVAERDTSAANLRTLAEAMRRAGIWNTPTLTVANASYPPKRAKDVVLGRFMKALHDAGAGLLLGTDNKDLVRELEAMVSWGLTPYQALVTGTRNVAEFFGALEETGTVAVSKRADLVLLAGNPLQDIHYTARPAGVMIGGRWLPREEIDRRLGREETWQQSQRWLDWIFTYYANQAFLEGITLSAAQEETLKQFQAAHLAQRRAFTDTLGPLRPGMDGRTRRQQALGLFVRQIGEVRAGLTAEQRAVFDSKVQGWRQHYTAQGYDVPFPT